MTRGRSGQSCGRGLAWSMISACQCSVQQNADDPGSRFEAAREFKPRRPNQTWPSLVRDEQDFWKSGSDLNLKGGALLASRITWTLGLALRAGKDPAWLDYRPRVGQLVCSRKLLRESPLPDYPSTRPIQIGRSTPQKNRGRDLQSNACLGIFPLRGRTLSSRDEITYGKGLEI